MKNSFYQENNLKQSILLAPNTHINSQNAYSSLKNSMLDFEHSQLSTLRGEKPLQESIVIQNYGDEPKDFQIEIERRYQKSNLSKSYSFPRHTVTKETNEDSCNSPGSSSSSSSLNSLKQVTSYNLHAQNYKAESLYDVYSTSSNQTGDTHSTKNKSRNKSKTRKKEKIVLTEDINYIQDENTPIHNKYASNNLSNKASSSSLKLVQLIGMQINRNKESYTIQNPAPNVIQKEPAKKNKAASPYRYSCPKQKVYLVNPHNNQRNSAKNNLRNSAAFDNTRKKGIEEKSANQTEKSEYYIRKTWERKKSPGLSEYKKVQQISGLQSPQLRNDIISLKKILGNKDLNSNSG